MTRVVSIAIAILVSPLALAWVAREWIAGRRRGGRQLDAGPPRCPDCGGDVDELPEGQVALVGVIRVRCRRCGRRTLAEWR